MTWLVGAVLYVVFGFLSWFFEPDL